MSWPDHVLRTVDLLNGISRELEARFVGRERAARLLSLAAVCREHLLLLGEPGTAKTELVNWFAQRVQARQFSYLLTRFTEPSELFGTLDVARFQKGEYTVLTEKMLPDAELAFLDEVFQGGSAILNTLLTLVNERVFHNGAQRQRVPLICLLGASNSLPDDPTLRAFADRFLLRLRVESVGGAELDRLVALGWDNERERSRRERDKASGRGGPVTTAALAELAGRLWEVDMSHIRLTYQDVIRELLAQGVSLSDRRIVRGQKLVAGAALLRKDDTARARDLWPLAHFWSDPADAPLVGQVVAPRVDDDGGATTAERRPAAEIVDLGRVLADNLDDPARGIPSEGAVVSTLSDLNRLRQELLRDHPGDGASLAELQHLVNRVNARLGGAA